MRNRRGQRGVATRSRWIAAGAAAAVAAGLGLFWLHAGRAAAPAEASAAGVALGAGVGSGDAAAAAEPPAEAPEGIAKTAISAVRPMDPATVARVAEVARSVAEAQRAQGGFTSAPVRREKAAPSTAGSFSQASVRAPLRPRLDAPIATRLALLQASDVLRRVDTGVEVAGVTHTKVQLEKQGLPVLNRVARLHERGGQTLGLSGELALPPLAPSGWGDATVDAASALALARTLTGATDLRGEPRVEQGWFAGPTETAPAWRVTLPARAPMATWQVTLDARSGGMLGMVDLVRMVQGTGSVYPKNLVQTPTPTPEPLFDLDGSGYLSGVYTRVLDPRAASALRPDDVFAFAPSSPGFTQTSVYRALTDTGRFATGLGFPPFAKPVLSFVNLADPLAPGQELNNAFYDPGIPPAGLGLPPIVPPTFGFGNGDGVLTANLGTDFDVAAHEMGHHFFEILVAPLILSSQDPVLAMTEGVADTFSALVGGDPNVGESVIPGQPFLRTVDNATTLANVAASVDPHEIGLVYGGANWDLVTGFGPFAGMGANAFTQLLFAALPNLPPNPFEFEYAQALRDADAGLFAGAHQALIDAVFTARGFDAVSPPQGFQGFLQDGIGKDGALVETPPGQPDPNLAIYLFFEFPNSEAVSFEATGPGNVSLIVAPLNFDPNNPVTVTSFDGVAGTPEVVTLTRTSQPLNVDADDAWFVIVADAPGDGQSPSFTVKATTTLPAATIAINGPVVNGTLTHTGQVDFFTFDGTAGQVVRLEGTATSGSVDPLVAIVDPVNFHVYGVDDDSGPGQNALIQGALLDKTQKYAVIMLSPVADVDPTAGTGGYALTLTSCDNVGTDTDGDGLVDACDDDDDNDGFIDSQDKDPLSKFSCADIDLDGCDDCSSGLGPDIMNDGPDNDHDGICDAGDLDDDNDGCTDAKDPFPFLASADDDNDGIGNDCDNCRYVPNPGQEDRGGRGAGSPPDGIGDACQCGDVNSDGRVTAIDAVVISRSLLNPPTASMTAEERRRCDVGGSLGCSVTDAVLIRRSLLSPPTATLLQQCPAANP